MNATNDNGFNYALFDKSNVMLFTSDVSIRFLCCPQSFPVVHADASEHKPARDPHPTHVCITAKSHAVQRLGP